MSLTVWPAPLLPAAGPLLQLPRSRLSRLSSCIVPGYVECRCSRRCSCCWLWPWGWPWGRRRAAAAGWQARAQSPTLQGSCCWLAPQSPLPASQPARHDIGNAAHGGVAPHESTIVQDGRQPGVDGCRHACRRREGGAGLSGVPRQAAPTSSRAACVPDSLCAVTMPHCCRIPLAVGRMQGSFRG